MIAAVYARKATEEGRGIAMGSLYRPKLKSTTAALLAWWFLMLGQQGEDKLVGPFKNAGDCDKARVWVEPQTALAFRRQASPCWEG